MTVKWRWIQKIGHRWVDNLICYSLTNKEHILAFREAIKYLDRPDCVRLIVEKGDLKK